MDDDDRLQQLTEQAVREEGLLTEVTDHFLRVQPCPPPHGISPEFLPALVWQSCNLLARGATRASLVVEACRALNVAPEPMRAFIDEVFKTLKVVAVADAHGVIAAKPDETRVYSQEEDLATMGRHLGVCVRAFAARDFGLCASGSTAALLSHPQFAFFQLLVISLQRQGRDAEAHSAGQRACRVLKYQHWPLALMGITLGHEDPERLLARAATDHERCGVLYYAGAHALTKGNVEVARNALSECVRFDTTFLEQQLAAADLESLSGTAAGNKKTLSSRLRLLFRR